METSVVKDISLILCQKMTVQKQIEPWEPVRGECVEFINAAVCISVCHKSCHMQLFHIHFLLQIHDDPNRMLQVGKLCSLSLSLTHAHTHTQAHA
jgi:hypothetical protein